MDITSSGPAGARTHALRSIGLFLALWTSYLSTLYMAVLAPRYLPAGPTRVFIVFVPFLMLVTVVCIVYWIYRAGDEYIRQRILRSAALTGIILAVATLGYFCLEQLGYPPRSMIVVNLLGWLLFSVPVLWIVNRTR